MKVLIVGAGIIGMTLAYEWIKLNPNDEIIIIDKEAHEAFHASGKNSGILHAGFYYNTDSLKAKLTADGNKLMKKFCKSKNIKINETGKLVVAKNEEEVETLKELAKRSEANGAGAFLISEEEAKKIDSNAKSRKIANNFSALLTTNYPPHTRNSFSIFHFPFFTFHQHPLKPHSKTH